MNLEMLIGNLFFFGILALIYILRGKHSKNIASFISVTYCSFMQFYFFNYKKYWVVLIFSIIGLFSIYLLYLTEKKYKGEKKIYRKNKFIFVFLSYFTGMFGGHRFYLQQKVLAAFYMLFFWTTIPLFLSIIEAIIYLIIPKKVFDKRYNSQELTGFLDVLHYSVFEKENFNLKKKNEKTNEFCKEITPLIGELSATGKKDKYLIEIETDYSKYKFTVEKGQIINYWKRGMTEERQYEPLYLYSKVDNQSELN